MAYTLSASGRKSDVIGQLRQQAASQAAALPSQGERDNLNASLDEAEKMVEAHAGDGDSVGVTLSGHISQSDTALSMSKQVNVSIARGAVAAADARESRTTNAANTGSGVDASASAAATPAERRTPRI